MSIGTKINIMNCEIIKNIGSTIQPSFKIELVYHTSYNCLFPHFYNNAKIAIEEKMIKYLIFIIELKNYNIVLS